MRFLRIALVTTLMIGVGASAFAAESARGKAKGPVSVGEFAVMVAAATSGNRGVEAGKAVDLLIDKGVPLGDASARLTERKLMEILGFYGVKAVTANPSNVISANRAQAAAGLIASSDMGRAAAASIHGPSPQTLDDCLALANHGQCVNCCKEFGTTAKQCSQKCMTINKPSASEPLP